METDVSAVPLLACPRVEKCILMDTLACSSSTPCCRKSPTKGIQPKVSFLPGHAQHEKNRGHGPLNHLASVGGMEGMRLHPWGGGGALAECLLEGFLLLLDLGLFRIFKVDKGLLCLLLQLPASLEPALRKGASESFLEGYRAVRCFD